MDSLQIVLEIICTGLLSDSKRTKILSLIFLYILRFISGDILFFDIFLYKYIYKKSQNRDA